MTIIDFMREKLTSYPKISEFLINSDIHIDFTEPEPTNYGLSSNGDRMLKKDLLGVQTRRHNFVLYAIGQSITDNNRLANSNFLYELAHWLEHLPEEEFTMDVNGKDVKTTFIEATTENAMSMGLMGETINDGIMYQIQIYAIYKIESED